MKLKIYRNQLKLEVDTETRKSAFFQINADAQEERNEAQLGSEFSDRSYFERSCQQGVDALLDVLHKFVTECNEEEVLADEADNKLEDTKCWVIDCTFDGRRNIISRSLASVCHKYIAYHMLYRWAVMCMPALVNEYKDQRERTRLDVQRIVYRKEAPVLEPDGSEPTPSGETISEAIATLKSQVAALTPTPIYVDSIKGSTADSLTDLNDKDLPDSLISTLSALITNKKPIRLVGQKIDYVLTSFDTSTKSKPTAFAQTADFACEVILNFTAKKIYVNEIGLRHVVVDVSSVPDCGTNYPSQLNGKTLTDAIMSQLQDAIGSNKPLFLRTPNYCVPASLYKPSDSSYTMYVVDRNEEGVIQMMIDIPTKVVTITDV